ncbi:hypothetical protein [Kocuria aegyptia]|uniref:Uncharacterized protein n=1 Tax=Kocuria aegyptia TaxID=330943 RepID=A0ABN2K8N4_9MICC
MTSPPQGPGNPGHPYEPSRSTPHYYTSGGQPEGTGRDPGRRRGAVPVPPQLKRLLGLTVASGALYAALGIVLAILSVLGFLGNLFGFWLYGQWAIALIAIGIAFIAVNIAWPVTALQAPTRDWSTAQRYTR